MEHKAVGQPQELKHTVASSSMLRILQKDSKTSC